MIRSAFVTIKDMDKKALERNILLSTFVFAVLNHSGYHCNLLISLKRDSKREK